MRPVSAQGPRSLSSNAQAMRLKPRPDEADAASMGHAFQRVAGVLSACSLTLALVWGCARETPAVDADWPAGALLAAQSDALGALLDAFASQPETPLGRTARSLRDALPPGCAEVEGRAPDGRVETLAASLRCADADPSLTGLRAWRGDDAIALAWPAAAGMRPLLRARREGSDFGALLEWSHPPVGDLADLLPGAEAAGPAVLAHDAHVVHTRVRGRAAPNFADWVESGGQGDRMFRLRSELFSAAVLDGSWELAIYPPAPDARMPEIALAIGVRVGAAARRAVDEFVSQLEETWQLRRSPVEIAGRSAECLLSLRVLPEFAPCVAHVEGAIVVAWSPQSLATALASSEARAAFAAPARLETRLDRLRDADLALARRNAPESARMPTTWPWRRLVAEALPRERGMALRIVLEGDES